MTSTTCVVFGASVGAAGAGAVAAVRGRRCCAAFSTSRRNSAMGSGWSSTCSRSTASLLSHTPPPFFTTTIAADCMPRVSPPAACPASRAASSRTDRCPAVCSKARIISVTTASPARMFPCAVL
jgi:hypothetical protein